MTVNRFTEKLLRILLAIRVRAALTRKKSDRKPVLSALLIARVAGRFAGQREARRDSLGGASEHIRPLTVAVCSAERATTF